MIHCGKFEKRRDSLRFCFWLTNNYSYIKLYTFLVILIPHLSPIVGFELGKNSGEVSKWRLACIPVSFYNSEKGQGQVTAATGACALTLNPNGVTVNPNRNPNPYVTIEWEGRTRILQSTPVSVQKRSKFPYLSASSSAMVAPRYELGARTEIGLVRLLSVHLRATSPKMVQFLRATVCQVLLQLAGFRKN